MTQAIEKQIMAGNVYLPSDIIRSNRVITRRHPEEHPVSRAAVCVTRKQLLVLEAYGKV